jgi:periplasmic copper chaperone A
MVKFLPKTLQNRPTGALSMAALLAGAAALSAALCGDLVSPAAAAGDYDVGSIHISQPWSRATPKGAPSGAGYMTLTNKGTAPDRVSCVSDDASAQCQIHTMTMENEVMKMRPAEGGLEIKPGESVTLKPGGNHMMFLSLKHPLEKGGMVKATLQFDHAGTIDVEYPVLAVGAPAPDASAGGSMQAPGGAMHMQGQGSMQGGGMQGGGMQGGGMMQMDKR